MAPAQSEVPICRPQSYVRPLGLHRDDSCRSQVSPVAMETLVHAGSRVRGGWDPFCMAVTSQGGSRPSKEHFHVWVPRWPAYNATLLYNGFLYSLPGLLGTGLGQWGSPQWENWQNHGGKEHRGGAQGVEVSPCVGCVSGDCADHIFLRKSLSVSYTPSPPHPFWP